MPGIIGRTGIRVYEQTALDLLKNAGAFIDDGNTDLIADAIAKSDIDCIEAFDPNNDMSVSEARSAWPDKILWLNFPSADHLQSPVEVEETTRQIIKEATPGDRFLIGITENVPHNKWPHSYAAIARVINSTGQVPAA